MDVVKEELKRTLVGKNVLIACSTGVDSTVLLDIVYNLKITNKLIIAHINHKRRIESDQEEAYLVNYASNHGLKIYVKHLQVYEGNNFQSWARDERYDFIKEIASIEQIDYVLTAHHANDQAETYIMRLLRTSSLSGLAGIKKWSLFKELPVYRPLLETPKQKLYDYAKENNITYFEDQSNTSDEYLRNRIRKYFVPLFENENPKFLESVSLITKQMEELSEYLNEVVNSFIKNEVLVHNNGNQFTIKREKFLSCLDFFQVEVIFTLLKRFNLSRALVDEVINQIKIVKEPIVYHVTKNLLMIKEYGNIIFISDFNPELFYLKIDDLGNYSLPYNQELIVDKNICYYKATNKNICYNIQELPIYVRTRQEGDRIKFKSGTKKVSDYLTDKKIPYIVRNQLLLLCDKDNEVIAILGLASRVNKKEI